MLWWRSPQAITHKLQCTLAVSTNHMHLFVINHDDANSNVIWVLIRQVWYAHIRPGASYNPRDSISVLPQAVLPIVESAESSWIGNDSVCQLLNRPPVPAALHLIKLQFCHRHRVRTIPKKAPNTQYPLLLASSDTNIQYQYQYQCIV